MVDATSEAVLERVRHGFFDNRGLRLHYTDMGQGPLIVMLHGFPDFWFTWRYQMAALAPDYRTVAMDMRGYNLSDRPEGAAEYRMPLLCSDVVALIEHLGEESAMILGHDWGGMIAWAMGMFEPSRTSRVMVVNVPHPRALQRELAVNRQQREYATIVRAFQREGSHESLNVEQLMDLLPQEAPEEEYLECLVKSDFAAMLAYFQANYPREPYVENTAPVRPVRCPVLQIHGLDDTAYVPEVLRDTWRWVESDYTLVTVPGAGHWLHQEQPTLVNRSIAMWLLTH